MILKKCVAARPPKSVPILGVVRLPDVLEDCLFDLVFGMLFAEF